MLSCDTFALAQNRFQEQRNVFAKNSDRPLGEAQPLAWFPPADYPLGEKVSCTHITIDQVSHTYGVLGCKPYWIWGFEMGVNEFGLSIGNEAEGSRCEPEAEDGLLGMDLIRLALERSKNAREAVDVITALLQAYGQNGNASPLFDRRYENSFLLVDPQEIWLLETAGRQWAARKIQDHCAISNCYTIGSQFDLASKNLQDYAASRRWLGPKESFDFAKAYTLPAVRQSNSVHRWRRMEKRITEQEAPLSLSHIQSILRDHFEGEIIEPRYGSCYGGFTTICMHAMTWDSAQTTCSLISRWDSLLGPIMLYAPSSPCCSVYLPVYWNNPPELLTKGSSTYDPHSLWWQTERLAMAVSIDENRFGPSTRAALQQLENQLEEKRVITEAQAHRLVSEKKQDAAFDLLKTLTEDASTALMKLVCTLCDQILTQVHGDGGLYGPRKEFLEAYSKRVLLPL